MPPAAPTRAAIVNEATRLGLAQRKTWVATVVQPFEPRRLVEVVVVEVVVVGGVGFERLTFSICFVDFRG